jgi:hypothetical protein
MPSCMEYWYSKKIQNQKRLIFNYRPIHTGENTELQSHWTAPLNSKIAFFSYEQYPYECGEREFRE